MSIKLRGKKKPIISIISVILVIPFLFSTLCDKVCQWLATGRWFSPGIPVSSTNKTDYHDITEILLKVALNTYKQKQKTTTSFFVLTVWSYAIQR